MITCLITWDKNIVIVLLSIFYIIIAQQCKKKYIYINVVSLLNEKNYENFENYEIWDIFMFTAQRRIWFYDYCPPRIIAPG